MLKGKLSGLVVNIKDSRSEPWSLDVGSNPGFTKKTKLKGGPRLVEEEVAQCSIFPKSKHSCG